jgi:hypothetical protein
MQSEAGAAAALESFDSAVFKVNYFFRRQK